MPQQPLEKFQHFVSKMQLKRFVDGSGRLHVWNKDAGKLLSQKPDKTFGQTHLYTTENAAGDKDTWFERELNKLETPANILLSKIETAAAENLAPTLSADEKAQLDLFLYTTWKRVPDFFDKAESIRAGEQLLDAIFVKLRERFPQRASQLDALDDPASRRRLLQEGKIRGIASVSEKIVGLIASRGLMVLRLPPGGPGFIIGSLPVVRTAIPLTEATGEAWLPISPRLMIGPGLSKDRVTLAEFDPGALEEVNRVIANQSTMFGGPDERQILALRDWLQGRA